MNFRQEGNWVLLVCYILLLEEVTHFFKFKTGNSMIKLSVTNEFYSHKYFSVTCCYYFSNSGASYYKKNSFII